MSFPGLPFPRTATGAASILPPTPWHYSGDLLTVEYRTDPANVRAVLPPDVELARDDEDPGAVAFVLLLVTMAAMTIGIAVPASASTPASFTLTAGTLSVSTPTTAISLGTQIASTSSSIMSGSLGAVSVSDQRGGPTTWTASVISTAFTPSGGPADPASNVSYSAGPIVETGPVVATPIAVTDLTGVVTVVTGVSTGISTATWSPTISILVPANFAPGVYLATITSSVA
jgi:hypothetical protein